MRVKGEKRLVGRSFAFALGFAIGVITGTGFFVLHFSSIVADVAGWDRVETMEEFWREFKQEGEE